ncbi:MAG: 5'-methylthioadenosine/adenosylhomocysteine nucleosidase [Chloroflexi bacterium]|nr:5'-methylthioadenosine/adenosylhomocysteine nucleosidase [Chloroflexota bacterium]
MIVGVLGALPIEVAPVRAAMQVSETATVAGVRMWRGTLAGRPLVLGQMGVGKVQAAMAAQMLIDRWQPVALVVTGTAGALDPDLGVGDVVVARAVRPHDVGAHLPDGFQPTGVRTFDERGRSVMRRDLPADPALVERALVAGEGLPFRVLAGAVVSGDQVILHAERRQWLREAFAAQAVEMEGAAVAQVAAAHGIPWVIVRGISDVGDVVVPLDALNRYAEDGAAETWGRRLRVLLADPAVVWRAGRLLGDLRRAARNAAQVTLALAQSV